MTATTIRRTKQVLTVLCQEFFFLNTILMSST